ncbi:MOSC domain-containing protein [Lysinibacillus sp. MHQ-1]|nr:MOSC domain-containing protein [Lysinibacillus sp. MHQ-1]
MMLLIKKHHGGPDRAVCLYPAEHYIQWEQELGKPLPTAAFGENLTVTNMLEADTCIGDIYKIGDAVIQITQGRVPCSTIDKYTESNTLLKRMIETGYTGFLGRVLEEGTICASSNIELVEKHPAQVSVLYCNEVYFKKQRCGCDETYPSSRCIGGRLETEVRKKEFRFCKVK